MLENLISTPILGLLGPNLGHIFLYIFQLY